jgi:Mn-dependent DtxR family transcriptional regulator
MTENPAPHPNPADGNRSEPEAVHVSDEAVRRLVEALAYLAKDPAKEAIPSLGRAHTHARYERPRSPVPRR